MNRQATGVLAGTAAAALAGGAIMLAAFSGKKKNRGLRMMRSAARKAVQGAETMLGELCSFCK